MSKILLTALALVAMTGFAMAGKLITPAPLLGAVAGPWGLAAGVIGYGAYRMFKGKR